MAGGERSLLNLLRHFDRSKFHAWVVCDASDDFAEAVHETGAPVTRVRFPGLRLPGLGAWRAVHGLLATCRSSGAALLHANTPRTNLYTAVVGRLAGIPVVWH
ncbi:MAG: hypothetical protein E6K62_03755, partial [Nitrospirae bacterium]